MTFLVAITASFNLSGIFFLVSSENQASDSDFMVRGEYGKIFDPAKYFVNFTHYLLLLLHYFYLFYWLICTYKQIVLWIDVNFGKVPRSEDE